MRIRLCIAFAFQLISTCSHYLFVVLLRDVLPGDLDYSAEQVKTDVEGVFTTCFNAFVECLVNGDNGPDDDGKAWTTETASLGGVVKTFVEPRRLLLNAFADGLSFEPIQRMHGCSTLTNIFREVPSEYLQKIVFSEFELNLPLVLHYLTCGEYNVLCVKRLFDANCTLTDDLDNANTQEQRFFDKIFLPYIEAKSYDDKAKAADEKFLPMFVKYCTGSPFLPPVLSYRATEVECPIKVKIEFRDNAE